MRKRCISYAGALGLALAVAIPGSALAAGTQRVEAGFLPEFNTNVPIPPPSVDLGDKHSKAGTLYTRLFLENYGTNPSSAGVFDIHAPEELKFNTKGLPTCNPEAIRGQSPETAREVCDDAFLGLGGATVFAGGQLVPSDVSLFNGTKSNGNPSVLFHSEVASVVIVAEMQDSPLPGYGTLFHSLVAQAAGGPVPNATPIVDTDFTLSKKYKDKKILRKAKKAKRKGNTRKYRRLKKKAKKSWVQGRCTDGELTTQIDVTYTAGGGPPQTANATQPCS
jgi:hypothetical protein